MSKRNSLLFFLFFFGLLIFSPYASWSQLVMGQYEDEAPFRTWNTLGIKTASSLAMGEISFSLVSDCSVALSNPALLSKLPKVTFTLNTSYNLASFFKYSFVNTGVLTSEKNISIGFYAFDFAGLSLRFKNWAFALSWAQIENYDRPLTEGQYKWMNNLYYFINLNQRGSLKNINFSISKKLFRRLSVGLGLNFVYGHLKKDITEKWVMDNITITDSKSFEFSGFYLNGGLSFDLTEKLNVAAIFRTPYIKKSESLSLQRYYAPAGGTDIKIEASSNNEYKQPLVLGLGASYRISKKLRVGSDFAFYNWSKYRVEYFGESLLRNFKDVIKIGLGAEYVDSFELWHQKFTIPIRAGFSYDPQPMKEPNSSYYYFTFGSGLYWKKLLFDIGILIGEEKGSGNSLKATKVVYSLSYQF